MHSAEQIAALTRRGQAAAERLMVDTVTITRRAGEPTTDPMTGVVDYPVAVVYSGRGRIQYRENQSDTELDAAQRFTVNTFILQVPATVDLRIDDEATVTASGMDDQDHPGRTFRVTGTPRKTHMTATRAAVTEVQP